jgi:K+-transporting ATPase KdpF subunit
MFRGGFSLCQRMPAAERRPTRMSLNLLLLGIAAALMVYLVYALLRPEKF